MTTIFLIILGLFIFWLFKGMRDSFALKNELVDILVNEYDLTRADAINLVDQKKRRIFDLKQENRSPIYIAAVIYQLSDNRKIF